MLALSPYPKILCIWLNTSPSPASAAVEGKGRDTEVLLAAAHKYVRACTHTRAHYPRERLIGRNPPAVLYHLK